MATVYYQPMKGDPLMEVETEIPSIDVVFEEPVIEESVSEVLPAQPVLVTMLPVGAPNIDNNASFVHPMLSFGLLKIKPKG